LTENQETTDQIMQLGSSSRSTVRSVVSSKRGRGRRRGRQAACSSSEENVSLDEESNLMQPSTSSQIPARKKAPGKRGQHLKKKPKASRPETNEAPIPSTSGRVRRKRIMSIASKSRTRFSSRNIKLRNNRSCSTLDHNNDDEHTHSGTERPRRETAAKHRCPIPRCGQQFSREDVRDRHV